MRRLIVMVHTIPDEIISEMEAQAASLRWMQSSALQRNDLQLANTYGDRAKAFDLAIVVLRHHNGAASVVVTAGGIIGTDFHK
jgi:hypothetical protein